MIFGGRLTPRYLLQDSDLEAVYSFANENGWKKIGEKAQDHQIAWRIPGRMTLHYEEDSVSGYSYVFLAGDDLRALPNWVSLLQRSLSLWSRDELLRAAIDASTGPERARAVLRLGLGAPMEFDQEFFDVISSCMQAGETPLRDTGVFAAGAVAWAQFRPILRKLAAEDSEAEVREMAQATLRAYDEFRIEESL